MGKNKKEKPELTLENLNRAIRTYQREEVLYLIQHGILKDIPEDEILEEAEDDGMDEVTSLRQQLETASKKNAKLKMQMVALLDVLTNVKDCLAQMPEFEKMQED